MARSNNPFACQDGILYIKLKESGILPLVAMIDALPHTFFGRSKNAPAYITVERAITWHETELRESKGRSGRPDVLRALKAALSQFQEGRTTFRFEQAPGKPAQAKRGSDAGAKKKANQRRRRE